MARPTKLTPACIQKLEDAYLSDATNLEAAIYAGISESLLYEYKADHPEFVEKIEALKGLTGLKAKVNVRKAVEREGEIETNDKGKVIKKGTGDSKWYLERRDDDFKYKSEVKNEVVGDAATALIEAIRGRKAERGIKE